jgi:DNA repair protein RadC
MAIARWPAGERPRERLYWNGADALADAELIALQLGSGRRGKTAVEVAREMLAAYGSLAGVAGREVTELAKLPGVGPAKAARLA